MSLGNVNLRGVVSKYPLTLQKKSSYDVGRVGWSGGAIYGKDQRQAPRISSSSSSWPTCFCGNKRSSTAPLSLTDGGSVPSPIIQKGVTTGYFNERGTIEMPRS